MTALKAGSTFITVGFGASAGGLEALESFFDAMPSTDQCAFAVVQHLSPDYKSLMAELLSKHTAFPIHQAEDGIAVEAGNIYRDSPKEEHDHVPGETVPHRPGAGAQPPYRYLPAVAGRGSGRDRSRRDSLRNRQRRYPRGAFGQGSRRHRHGPDDQTARFDGMPRSAISTEIVDYVLPPDHMPRELQNYVSGTVTLAGEVPRDLGSGSTLSKICLLIKRKTGVDLSFYKESTIIRRIERRMGINQIEDIRRYVDYMESNPNEIPTLFKETLIGVTRFFRDAEAFELIKSRVIPEIVHQKEGSEPIRVWVAGCSTGEEAYGLATLFADYLREQRLTNEVNIFATDIDKGAIDIASMGI